MSAHEISENATQLPGTLLSITYLCLFKVFPNATVHHKNNVGGFLHVVGVCDVHLALASRLARTDASCFPSVITIIFLR